MKKLLFVFALLTCLTLCACAPGAPSADVDPSPAPPAEEPAPSTAADQTDFFDSAKAYILSGQDELPEAGKLNWSLRFLEAVDCETTHQSYLKDAGDPNDPVAFAAYLTENAPIQENWKALFEQDLMDVYAQTPDHYEDLDGGLIQVYVSLDDQVVPYVVVNTRTGAF